ncbi:MAG TPA: arylamine N-acetyltransferase [Candidatus Sulfotelmatobacter sp.]|nr:arylamine N-acetyltransferase [Candidatus Sulfotelmatobacter sp.]
MRKSIRTSPKLEGAEVLLGSESVYRYLDALGVSRPPASLRGLKQLVLAQLTRVPFENISKLYYKKQYGFADMPSLARYLEGIEKYHFGGTCYANNFHFYRLLVSLGFEAKLCAADMATPDVHAVIMVTVDGREYLVDAGYAAPFLEPLPRDLRTDQVVALGGDRYVLRPQDEAGRSRLELYRNDVLKHGYVAKPAPRKIGDFRQVIADSFRPEATFLNSILVTRFFPGCSIVVHNLSLIQSQGEYCEIRSLRKTDEMVAAIQEHIGIPGEIVVGAVADLTEMQDAWG